MSSPSEPALRGLGDSDPTTLDGPATNSTHQRLLASAVRLFAARGFHGTGIRDLAAAAGLSTASLYHYMGTKERLLFQIMQDALHRLNTAAETIEQRTAAPAVRLAALVRMHVVTHALHRDASIVVDNELGALEDEQREAIVAQRDTYERFWADAIAAGVAAGQFAVPDQRIARIALLEICSGVATWYSRGGDESLERIAEIHVDLASGLLSVPREPAEWVDPARHMDVYALVDQIWALRDWRTDPPR